MLSLYAGIRVATTILLGVALLFVILFVSAYFFGYQYLASRLNEQQAPKSRLGLVEAKEHGDSTTEKEDASRQTISKSVQRGTDLIFVHGLGSNPDTTWLATTHKSHRTDFDSRSESRFNRQPQAVDWINGFLREDLLDGLRDNLRIFYFNHDSYWRRDALRMRLDEIARNLLAALQLLTSQSHGAVQRDIIIISHSYGGLVVKKAIVFASEGKDCLLHRVKGVVFLGCPHQGTRIASLGRLAARFLWLLNADPTVFDELGYRSPALHELQMTFSQAVQNHGIRTINLYEKRTTDLLGYRLPVCSVKIVSEDSARLGCQHDYPVETDHSGLNKYPSRESPGYETIRARLVDLLQALETIRDKRAKDRYVVPANLVSTFVPRKGLQKELNAHLLITKPPKEAVQFVTLTGAGGTGKTQLVLSFLHDHRFRYDAILWLDAASEETIRASFKICTAALSIAYTAEDNSTGSVRDAPEVRALLSWLARQTLPGQQWLVVVDNADELDWGVRHIIPREGNGTVIITSRDNYAPSMTGHDSVRISVEAMHRTEARTLLLKACDQEIVVKHDEVVALAEEIVARLENLPVAVDLAGAYIRESRAHSDVASAMRQYLKHYSTNRDRLLKLNIFNGISTYNQTVWTTWDTTLQTIDEQYTKRQQDGAVSPIQLLTFISLFDRSGINHEIFELASAGLAQIAPDFLDESFDLPCWLKRLLAIDEQNQWDDWAMIDAMSTLQRYNLIQSQDRGGSAYSMHELIRWRASSEASDSAWQTWYTIFLAMLIDQKSPPVSRGALRRQIIPHLPSVSQADEVLRDVEIFKRACTWHALGLAWYEEGRYATASEHFVKALQRRRGETYQDIRIELSSLSMLITCYIKLGHLDNAEDLAQHRLRILASRGPESHAEYLTALATLACIKRSQGRLDSAQSIGERVLNGLQSMLGEGHERTLGAKKDLALTYSQLGQYHKAEGLQLEVVEGRRVLYGENHKFHLASQSDLAISWSNLGKLEQARTMQEHVLEIKKSELGERHPETAHSLSHLAVTLVRLGKYDEAEVLEREAVTITSDAHGEDHMDTLVSQSNLAEIFLEQGRLDEAESLNREILVKKREVCGAEHPDTLASMNNLAAVLWERNKKEEAWDLMARTLEGMVRTMGFEHRRTIMVKEALEIYTADGLKL